MVCIFTVKRAGESHLGCQFVNTVLAFGATCDYLINLLKGRIVPQIRISPYCSLFQGDILYYNGSQRPYACWYAPYWL